MTRLLTVLILCFFCLLHIQCKKPIDNNFTLVNEDHLVNFYIDKDSDSLIFWAVNELANDIHTITGKKPKILKTNTFNKDAGVYFGLHTDKLFNDHSTVLNDLKNSWETFFIKKQNDKLIVAGSDVRGTVYGIFEIAEQLGISPWQWWADVVPESKKDLVLQLPEESNIQSPSVQYRGIFLNDEDWGLQPWAAKTFEPETGDIGPKTYEKIFQLLLRLKANTIWPAMHPSTNAFYNIKGNKEIAKKYHIIVGTSHAEPMLRNNVSEWKTNEYGEYNYFTNSNSVNNYWEARIKEVSDSLNETIITLGMRGIHDSHMEGGKSIEEQVLMLENIINTQRNMLSTHMDKNIESIPQVLIPYKEVLDLYDKGLNVPDDVTLMWTDDNYGYIRRLSNDNEQKRPGGSGVYYHLSYWGRPHDYLWLSTNQPGLTWFEMQKAYANGAKKIWIVNVGDIKPSEYNIEFFLDMAWDISSISENTIKDHLESWATREFGKETSKGVKQLMNEYYRLAFLRKPEYMGWSQTEPITNVQLSEFTNREALSRISKYESLLLQTDSLAKKINPELSSAWFQLIEYPIKGAAYMNQKFLYAQLATNETDEKLRKEYTSLSASAYSKIKSLTQFYNHNLNNGKWNGIMSMSPRSLPVYDSIPIDSLKEKIKKPANLHQETGTRIVFQANEYNDSKSYENYSWKTINGLGYSNKAITLFPLNTKSFKEQPWISYSFDIDKPDDFEVQINLIPTHSNNFDHKIGVQIDNDSIQQFNINTKGRSDQWKENVLRNSQRIKFNTKIDKPGTHTIKIYVNQTGIVIDQLSISSTANPPFYEIPY